jgi:MscS family membrane protein
MCATPFRKHSIIHLLLSCWFLMAAQAPIEATPPAPSPLAARPAQECLVSPRETVKTLYFAAVAYDKRPQLVDEAVACLDLTQPGTADPDQAVQLAIDLEQTLRILCIPLGSIPDKTDRDKVVIYDADAIKVTLARCSDGLWRFDRETVDRIPTMNRAALAKFRSMQTERAQLVDEYTDPSSTLRRFLQDMIARDFYSAARALDLSMLSNEERTDKGPWLAKQLAFVMQRRGWVFMQEVPNHPNGPPYTWHADKSGRIMLERVRLADGKEAWLFSKKTVRNIGVMYEQAKDRPADLRYVHLGAALAPLKAGDDPVLSKARPADVPPQLGSPRALLKGFFRAMDAAEAKDSKLADALEYLDLQALPQSDRAVQGTKIAIKLEAVLRKTHVDLSALPDDWNAPTQVLGQNEGVRVEIVRQRDGCWRFSQNTVNQTPAFFDKLAAKEKAERDRAAHLDSARDTMNTFLTCTRRGEYEQAAECLDLTRYRTGAQEEIGPVLAYKLRHVIDRIGRVYIQEVPDTPDGPRYIFYRGDLGRIVLARKADGAREGSWLFTPETVSLIESMFRSLLDQPIVEANADAAPPGATFWRQPGIWVRQHVPDALAVMCWRLQLYQWIGVALAVLFSGLAAWLVLAQVHRLFTLVLKKCGSVLTRQFVAAKLRPLTWVTGWWLMFQLFALLDLPIRVIDGMLPFKIFGMAGLIAWLGVQIVDLVTGVYTNSELLRPHRSMSDMIVPVTMRALKGIILLMVAVYVIYQVGQGDMLSRFLTGLGVAGLAASLAAQDALKSFFSTLLLIGERSFKIGDQIAVAGLEGVVEQVGFRATRLRTADGSLLTVPNSTIASAAIDNLTTKAFSRFKASLLVNYDTAPERILALRDRIRTWLMKHPHVSHDKVNVSVNRLTENGVEVTLNLHLADVSGAAERDLKEEINCEVLRLCNGEGQHPLAGGAQLKLTAA